MNFLSSDELRSELKTVIDDSSFDERFNIVNPVLIHDEVQKEDYLNIILQVYGIIL